MDIIHPMDGFTFSRHEATTPPGRQRVAPAEVPM
jgi:hypothetical protein